MHSAIEEDVHNIKNVLTMIAARSSREAELEATIELLRAQVAEMQDLLGAKTLSAITKSETSAAPDEDTEYGNISSILAQRKNARGDIPGTVIRRSGLPETTPPRRKLRVPRQMVSRCERQEVQELVARWFRADCHVRNEEGICVCARKEVERVWSATFSAMNF